MTKDLTVGAPGRVLINFTIPMFISVIFQQIYNIADSIIAGKYVGEDALAAIGASYPITMIFMAVAIGSQIGCSVVISRHFGTKEYIQTKTTIYTALICGLFLSSILTLIGVTASKPLMKLVNTPANIFDDGNAYLKIYVGGFIFLFLYNVSTGIFNSLGDSKTPLYLLIGSSLGNIVLDVLFVIKFSLGVSGVAWATFIAQGLACILALMILYTRVKSIKTSEKIPLFGFKELKEIIAISLPSILQQSFISIGNLFVQHMVNGFGSSVIAGYSAAIKLNSFVITSFTTFGNGISSFTAQNLGAGRLSRIREGFKAGAKFAMSVAFILAILYFAFAGSLVSLFMNSDGSALALNTGINFIRIVCPFYFIICLKLLSDGILRGSESMNYFMAATFTDLILRVIFALIFKNFLDETGIWFAWPISWIIGTAMSFMFYKKEVWLKNRQI